LGLRQAGQSHNRLHQVEFQIANFLSTEVLLPTSAKFAPLEGRTPQKVCELCEACSGRVGISLALRICPSENNTLFSNALSFFASLFFFFFFIFFGPLSKSSVKVR
jgi:hypothetical protein